MSTAGKVNWAGSDGSELYLEPTQLALLPFSSSPYFPSGLVITSANCPVPKAEGRGEKNNVILERVRDTQKGTPARAFSCEVWSLTGFLAVSRKGVS